MHGSLHVQRVLRAVAGEGSIDTSVWCRQKGSGMKTVNLLESIVETTEPSSSGFTVTSFSLSGEPYAAAIVDAVAATYELKTAEDLEPLIGKPITLQMIGENFCGAQAIYAVEGKLFQAASGAIALLPKGARKNGKRVNPAAVLDIVEGYGKIDVLRERVAARRAGFPQTSELTIEALAGLPNWNVERDDEGEGLVAAVALFGTARLPGEAQPGAIWLAHSYDPESDILEGVLLVPDGTFFSEHGSAYAKDLKRTYGLVEGFEPVSIAQAIDWTEPGGYEKALAHVAKGVKV